MDEFKNITLDEYKHLDEKEKDLYNFLVLENISQNIKKKCENCGTRKDVFWHWIIIIAIITGGLGFGKYLLSRLDAHEISQTAR